MDVSVVIVTYNSAPWIRACLDSVRAQQNVRLEILVVDNVSTDSTRQTVADAGPGIQLIPSTENVGFGRGCNRGVESSRGRFLYLLNPDTRLDQPDALSRLSRLMEQNPRWGILGTRILRPDGSVETMGETSYPYQERVRRDFSQLPGRFAWVSGASMFIRREAFAAVGGFDPEFFLSSEETDLCLRVRQAGWEIGFTPDITIKHVGFASETGIDPYQSWLRRVPGIYRFWSKHYPPDDVRRLIRRDWLRASFRREWYGVWSRFAGRDSKAWRKHREYAGISQAAREFLPTLAKPVPSVPPPPQP
jgi:N-acetylglucosaminyl-diphospho-decaprenol L-rhamnosyltransferase